MRITVLAKPGKKENKVVQTGLSDFTVSVKEVAQKGAANQAIILTLSDYLQVKPSEINLISGHTAKIKIFEVPNDAKPKKEFVFQENLL